MLLTAKNVKRFSSSRLIQFIQATENRIDYVKKKRIMWSQETATIITIHFDEIARAETELNRRRLLSYDCDTMERKQLGISSL